MENKEIAARLSLPTQIVSKWRKRFYEERLAGLQERPRGGRPPVFPPEVVALLEGEQAFGDFVERGEVVGGQHLALHHGEVDLNLVGGP